MQKKSIGCGCAGLIALFGILAISREFGWIPGFVGTALASLFSVFGIVAGNVGNPPVEIYTEGEAKVVATYPADDRNDGGVVEWAYTDSQGQFRQRRVTVRSKLSFNSLPIGAVRTIEICKLDTSVIRSEQFNNRGKDRCYELNEAVNFDETPAP